jgi:radical SAM protein with 4Fe4S-binding SPASM domain
MFCNKSFSFKHWLCNAGKNSLFINYDGLVYPCVEYSFDINNAIFNIKNKIEYKKYNFKQTICKLDFCACDWDIKKQKIFNKK